jgi:hypothetical protein
MADEDRLLRCKPLGCGADRRDGILPGKRGVDEAPVPRQVWCNDAMACTPKRFGE